MIQRYTVCHPKKVISNRFEAGILVPYKPSFNAGAGQKLPVITNKAPDRVSLFQWGLVPFDSKDAQIGDKLLNARVETIKAKQPYTDLLPDKRCIIIADSFYFWKELHGVSTPYRVIMKDESLFAIAGIWDEWKMEDDDENASFFGSFSMVTTEANNLIADFSERMPAILEPSQEKVWLDAIEDTPLEDLLKLIKPFDSAKMRFYKVSNLVNNLEINSAKVAKELNNTSTGHTLSLFD